MREIKITRQHPVTNEIYTDYEYFPSMRAAEAWAEGCNTAEDRHHVVVAVEASDFEFTEKYEY